MPTARHRGHLERHRSTLGVAVGLVAFVGVPMTRKLTRMQAAFAAHYRGRGTGTHAARLAGYAGNDQRLAETASKLLRHPGVCAALAARGVPTPGDPTPDGAEGEEGALTADDGDDLDAPAGVDPVAFWRRAMTDPATPPAQRQRASERLHLFLEKQALAGDEERSFRALRGKVLEILARKRARTAQEVSS